MIEHQIKCSYRYITHNAYFLPFLALLFVNYDGSMVIPITHREKNKNGPVN